MKRKEREMMEIMDEDGRIVEGERERQVTEPGYKCLNMHIFYII